MKNYYRPDIDGLRAIAVISVILFHAQVPGFAGGFVGVDIFFVISGFLITSIILRETKENRFSFKNFYIRRIRRLLPALLVVLISTSILAWNILSPEDFSNFGKSLVATILLVPNVATFKVSSDYFSATTENNPLLHLWSLGVEEQFYLIFPLILILSIKYLKRREHWPLIISTFLGSLLLALWFYNIKPSHSFYLLPTRIWEFSLGISAAYYFSIKSNTINEIRKRNILTLYILPILGILALIFSIIQFIEVTLEKSIYYQLLAAIGSVLIISSGQSQNTFLKKLLSTKFLVGIGLISYSLYLWHWPLLSLFKYGQSGLLSEYQILIVISILILSTILAFLTWKFIENPLREKEKISTKLIVKFTLIILVILFLLGVYAWKSNGIEGRFTPQQLRHFDSKYEKNSLFKTCHTDRYHTPDVKKNINECITGESRATLSLAIWGDSHSDSLMPAFSHLANKYKIKVYQLSMPSATPLLKLEFSPLQESRSEALSIFHTSVLDTIKNTPEISDVFLVGRWNLHILKMTKYDKYMKPYRANKSISYLSEKNETKAFKKSLEETILTLKKLGKRVWVVTQVPITDRNVPRWLGFNDTLGNNNIWIKSYPERHTALMPIFEKLASKHDIRLLKPTDYMCKPENGECIISSRGKSLYWDDNHLSVSGALYLTGMLEVAFDQIIQQKNTEQLKK